MGFQFYQSNCEFHSGSEAASFIAYATANLPFFTGPWLVQFSPCSALAGLWPGEKLANIVQELSSLHTQGNDCGRLSTEYKKIYRQLTMTDFSTENMDNHMTIP